MKVIAATMFLLMLYCFVLLIWNLVLRQNNKNLREILKEAVAYMRGQDKTIQGLWKGRKNG